MNSPHRRPLSLSCLRCFEAVARHLSFSAAAEEMHLSQPAVSRQIQGLEDELGSALFQRATRRVSLTSAGLALQRALEPGLASLDACVRQLRLSQGRALVSVTTFPSFASLWLMPRLPEFEQQHPDADIRLAASDRFVDLDDQQLDLALRHCRPDRAPPGAIRLFGEVLTPVIGTRLADAIRRGEAPPLHSPADLAGHTLLEMDDGSAHAQELLWPTWLARAGLPQLTPRRWMSMNYTHQQVQAALAGQGVALARLPMVHDALARGDLIEPFGLSGRRWSQWCYWLLRLAGAGDRPEAQAFGQWVQAQAALTRAAIGDHPDVDSTAQGD
jgi:LysR family transcriptional regulator, glycine cleavage system transcriptional activator